MGNPCWKKLKPVIITIQLAVSLASFVTNWWLYYDLIHVSPGLVFGPFPSEFCHTVLAFSILSTIFNILEVGSLCTELFRRNSNCYIGGNTASALIIWFDDIPKAAFMLYISFCQDRTISYVEALRSYLLIITALIRLIAFAARECYRKRRESRGLPTREELMKRNNCCRGVVYGAIMVGIFLKLLCVTLLFVFNNLTQENGNVAMKNPKGFFSARPNVERYAKNVSIYAEIRNRNEKWGWFPLVPLSHVTFLKSCNSTLLLMVNRSRVDIRCGTNFESAVNLKASPITKAGDKVEIKHSFRFIEPNSRLLLGNVEYITKSISGLAPDAQVQLKYFCSGVRADKGPIDHAFGLIPAKEFNYEGERVLGSDKRVSEAIYCWKTGKMKCKMRGLSGPEKVTKFSE